MFELRKVSSNYQVRLVLSLISKKVLTILHLLIYCLLIVAKPYKVFKVFRSDWAKYPWTIKLASLSKSIIAKTSSLLLFHWTFQEMHLTVFNFWSTSTSSRSFLLFVIGAEAFPMTAIFLAQNWDICYSSSRIFLIGNNCSYCDTIGWRCWQCLHHYLGAKICGSATPVTTIPPRLASKIATGIFTSWDLPFIVLICCTFRQLFLSWRPGPSWLWE